MKYTQEDFIRDIDADFYNARNNLGQKKKIRNLMDKYGNTRDEIEANSTMNDWLEYLMANGDELIDSIRAEKNNSILQHTPNDSTLILPKTDKEPEEIEEEEEEEEIISPTLPTFKNVNEKMAELSRRTRERLKRPDMEGSKDHIYLDSEGYISTGVGANINDKNAFMCLDWQKNGRPATQEEKEAAYNHFLQLQKDKKYGKGKKAEEFEKESDLRLPQATIDRLLDEHIQRNLRPLRTGIAGFDDFPIELQEVLLDIRYNTGNLFRSKWPKLREAIDKRDLDGIYNNVHRIKIQESRNKWAMDKIKSIKKF